MEKRFRINSKVFFAAMTQQNSAPYRINFTFIKIFGVMIFALTLDMHQIRRKSRHGRL